MVAMKDGFVDVHRGKRDAGLAGAASDLTATVADNFGVDKAMIGESFLDKLV